MKKNWTPKHLLGKAGIFQSRRFGKDRVALQMLSDAEKVGILKPDGTVIEQTSGNTGIGLAALAASCGYRAIIVMPDNMSIE